MCGIAGVLGMVPSSLRTNIIDNLAQSLAHRGPDGHGTFEDDKVGLVHTRLSIIDLSAKANQPFRNEDNTIILICNGEIYNYVELRADLEQRHQFSSGSDCEVILHLYKENRDNPDVLLNKLTGMFAFALWDSVRERLFVARDRLGIKPLYYTYTNGVFLFSSEVKPIATSGLKRFDIDYTSLYEYFLLKYIPGPATMFADIHSLEPGHYMKVENGRLNIHKYWDIPSAQSYVHSEKDAQAELEHLFSKVVKDHLVADVPVGTFLSAGVDSSLITAIAVDHHPGIMSFTACFLGEPEDESQIAQSTSDVLKTTHHPFTLQSGFFNDYATQFSNLDQPFGIQSALSLGRISKVAGKHVKVVLSGDGADELFGGYRRHGLPQHPAFLKYIPKALQDSFLSVCATVTGKKNLNQLRLVLKETEAERFFSKTNTEDTNAVNSFFRPAFFKQIDTQRYLSRIERLFKERDDKDPLNRILYVDMKTTLVDEMLTKCDRMTMINGVEGRVPFLDHRLVEFAFRLPGSMKRQGDVGKIILRRYLAKRLGDELAYRNKTGFNSPLRQWLRQDSETIAVANRGLEESKELPFLNSDFIQKGLEDVKNLRTPTIFALVTLNMFCRQLDKFDRSIHPA